MYTRRCRCSTLSSCRAYVRSYIVTYIHTCIYAYIHSTYIHAYIHTYIILHIYILLGSCGLTSPGMGIGYTWVVSLAEGESSSERNYLYKGVGKGAVRESPITQPCC